MHHEKEHLEAKKSFLKDYREDNPFLVKEESIKNENITDGVGNLRIVQQYNKANRGKKPVFH